MVCAKERKKESKRQGHIYLRCHQFDNLITNLGIPRWGSKHPSHIGQASQEFVFLSANTNMWLHNTFDKSGCYFQQKPPKAQRKSSLKWCKNNGVFFFKSWRTESRQQKTSCTIRRSQSINTDYLARSVSLGSFRDFIFSQCAQLVSAHWPTEQAVLLVC